MSVDSAVRTEDEIAVEKAMQRVIDAWEANDADAFAEAFAPDATLVTVEGLYTKGREPIRQTLAWLYGSVFKGSKCFNRAEDIRLTSKDSAIGVSWNGILLAGLSELPPEENRRATWAFSKHDGEWLVEAFHNVMITEATEGKYS